MDNNIIDDITFSLGINAADTQHISSALAEIFHETLTAGDSIALPAFGTFSPELTQEQVINDAISGKAQLIPPHVSVTFIPALKLTKRVKALR